MPARINADLAVAMCNFMVEQIDVGDEPATLTIYEGVQPMSPTIDSGVPLAIWELPNPAFAAATPMPSGGTALMNEVDPVAATVSGQADYFRLVSRDGIPLLDGSISDMSGDGMLKLNSVNVIENVNVVIDNLTITQRAF